MQEIEINFDLDQSNDLEFEGVSGSEDIGLDIDQVFRTPFTGRIFYDTTDHWNAQRDLITEKGALYVYSDYNIAVNEEGETVKVPAIKIGDGLAYLIDMPFTDAAFTQEMNDHIKNRVVHITDEERDFWNNKVTCFISQQNTETVVFTKENVKENA